MFARRTTRYKVSCHLPCEGGNNPVYPPHPESFKSSKAETFTANRKPLTPKFLLYLTHILHVTHSVLFHEGVGSNRYPHYHAFRRQSTQILPEYSKESLVQTFHHISTADNQMHILLRNKICFAQRLTRPERTGARGKSKKKTDTFVV